MAKILAALVRRIMGRTNAPRYLAPPPLKVANEPLGTVQWIKGDFPLKISFDVEIEGMKEIDNLIAMLSPLAEAERKSKAGS